MTSPEPEPEPAAAGDIDTAVLDGSRVAKLIDLDNGEVGLFTELVGLFRVAVHEHLDDLDECVAQGDAVSTKRAAHAICGESASMGAARAEQQARELEQLATQESLASAPSLAAALRQSVMHSLAAMDEEIARRTCAVP
jgi:HPt (histidine-containing phosphotransfer) domain-containing protein